MHTELNWITLLPCILNFVHHIQVNNELRSMVGKISFDMFHQVLYNAKFYLDPNVSQMFRNITDGQMHVFF